MDSVMTTRMVSPKPLSVFVPDVTLIAFSIPAGLARPVAERFPHAISISVRVKKVVPLLMLRANPVNPEPAPDSILKLAAF